MKPSSVTSVPGRVRRCCQGGNTSADLEFTPPGTESNTNTQTTLLPEVQQQQRYVHICRYIYGTWQSLTQKLTVMLSIHEGFLRLLRTKSTFSPVPSVFTAHQSVWTLSRWDRWSIQKFVIYSFCIFFGKVDVRVETEQVKEPICSCNFTQMINTWRWFVF